MNRYFIMDSFANEIVVGVIANVGYRFRTFQDAMIFIFHFPRVLDLRISNRRPSVLEC